MQLTKNLQFLELLEDDDLMALPPALDRTSQARKACADNDNLNTGRTCFRNALVADTGLDRHRLVRGGGDVRVE